MTNEMLYRIRLIAAMLSAIFGVSGFVFDSRLCFGLALVFASTWLLILFVLGNRAVNSAIKEDK